MLRGLATSLGLGRCCPGRKAGAWPAGSEEEGLDPGSPLGVGVTGYLVRGAGVSLPLPSYPRLTVSLYSLC